MIPLKVKMKQLLECDLKCPVVMSGVALDNVYANATENQTRRRK